MTYEKSESVVTQLYPTPCDPMDYSDPVNHGPPGSSLCPWNFLGKILEWIAISFSRGSSQLRDQNWVTRIAGRFFTVWATTLRIFATFALFL